MKRAPRTGWIDPPVLQPFFRMFGSKWGLSRLMPPPIFPVIRESHAGGAGYSLRFGAFQRVELNDSDPATAALWRWLFAATPAEVLELPLLTSTQDDIRWMGLDPAPMLLIQKWLTPQGSSSCWRPPPSMIASLPTHPGSWWSASTRARVASQLVAVRNWSITELDYPELECGEPATWIVDPLYQGNASSASAYRPSKPTDYAQLGRWCRGLTGQVFVHEQAGASWLPFETFTDRARTGRLIDGKLKFAHEVIWPPLP